MYYSADNAAKKLESSWGKDRKLRPQVELRPEEPKMEAAGRYYGKDQTDKERSDVSACIQ